MAILVGGRRTPLGEAVAECLASAGVEELGAFARGSDGLILCGDPADPSPLAALVEELAGSGKPLLYVSTAWVMGDTRGRLAGEAAPLRPPPSLAWLPAAERLLLDAVERRVRTVVIRPAVVYGERLPAQPLGAILSGEGSLENHWSFVHVDDLAELIALAWRSAPAGSLFVASDGPPVRRADVQAAALTEAKIAAPPPDARALDSRAGSTRAFRELGWRPSRPRILPWLAGLRS